MNPFLFFVEIALLIPIAVLVVVGLYCLLNDWG